MAQFDNYQDNPGYDRYSGRSKSINQFSDQQNQRNRENDYGFGNASFENRNDEYDDRRYKNDRNQNERSQDYGSYGHESRSDYNRVNYIPDNDEYPNSNKRDYENTSYGTSGTYGYRGEFGQDFRNRNLQPSQNQNISDNYTNQGRSNRYNDLNRSNYQNESRDWQNTNQAIGNHDRNYGRRDVYSTDRDYYGNYDHYRQANSPYGNSFSSYQSNYNSPGKNFSGEDYPNYIENINRNRDYRNENPNDNWWEKTKNRVSSWFSDDDNDRNRRYDQSSDYRGKGPKGYSRSADRIREDACDRLTDDDRVDASDINLEIQGRDVILTGTVHSREEKRRAEDLVEAISGVDNVENRLRINRNALGSHDYTGNTDSVGGIGRESGTTNEIIRNTGNKKNER